MVASSLGSMTIWAAAAGCRSCALGLGVTQAEGLGFDRPSVGEPSFRLTRLQAGEGGTTPAAGMLDWGIFGAVPSTTWGS